MFSSSLPAPQFALSRSRHLLGALRVLKKRGPLGKETAVRYTLACSVMFELTREEAEDVVIHEMIHYYIELNGLRDTSTHGRLFRSMMERINREYGRHVTISSERKALSPVAMSPPRRLCVVFLADVVGIGMCYTVPASTRVFFVARQLVHNPRVRRWRMFASYSPALAGARRVRTATFFDASPELIREVEAEGTELVMTGDRIVPKKR